MSFFVMWNFSSCTGLLNQYLLFNKRPTSTHRIRFPKRYFWAFLWVPLLFPLALDARRTALPYALCTLVQLFVFQMVWYPSSYESAHCWVEIFCFRRQLLVVKSLTPACLDEWWRQGWPSDPLSVWTFLRESWIHPQRPPRMTTRKPQQTSDALF